MAVKLSEFLAEHPVDRERVDEHKDRMLAEVRAYHLRELREAAGMNQEQLAVRIGVSQSLSRESVRGEADQQRRCRILRSGPAIEAEVTAGSGV